MTIGTFIKNKRIQYNISLRKFAKQSGIRVTEISAIEQGNKEPTIETFNILMEALDAGKYEFIITGVE